MDPRFYVKLTSRPKGLDEAIPERVYLTEMRKNSNPKEDISLTLTVTKNNFLENIIDISNNYVKLIRVEVSHAENWLIHTLHEREFYEEMRKLLAGTLVLIKDENLPSTKWSTGRITEIFPGTDGKVPVVNLRWYWDRTHDMPAMVGYLNHWATAALTFIGAALPPEREAPPRSSQKRYITRGLCSCRKVLRCHVEAKMAGQLRYGTLSIRCHDSCVVAVLICFPSIRCQIETHKIPHRQGASCTTVIIRSFENLNFEVEHPESGQGPPTSLPLLPVLQEDLRFKGYLEFFHAALAFFVYKHPCFLREANPGPTAQRSAALTTRPPFRYSDDIVTIKQ
ncbi:hypothetical protein TNCV_2391901 [Trichonephila clavipes]|nr:hypothetical protein TNCV_2391901 [Trichonephila clavipes]